MYFTPEVDRYTRYNNIKVSNWSVLFMFADIYLANIENKSHPFVDP